MEACEAIEQNIEVKGKEKKEKPQEQKKRVKFAKGAQKESIKYYCELHGKNTTHNTPNCYALKKQQKQSKQDKTVTVKRSFTKKGLKQEINFLSRRTPKVELLDEYLHVIQQEKDKLNKRAAKKAKRTMVTEPDSDSDESFANIEQVKKTKVKTAKKAKKTNQDMDVSDTDSEYDMALIEKISPTKDRMVDMQEQYLPNEKTEEEEEYLRSLHANDSDSASMDN